MKNLILLCLVVVSLASCSTSRNFYDVNYVYNNSTDYFVEDYYDTTLEEVHCDTTLNITKTINLMNNIDFYKDSIIIIIYSIANYELRIPRGILMNYTFFKTENDRIRFNNLIDSLKKDTKIIRLSSNYYSPVNQDKYFDIHFETLSISGNFFVYNNMLSEYLNEVKINEIKYECYGIDIHSYSTLHILYIDDFEFYKVWQIQC